jgi:hypothetical protein
LKHSERLAAEDLKAEVGGQPRLLPRKSTELRDQAQIAPSRSPLRPERAQPDTRESAFGAFLTTPATLGFVTLIHFTATWAEATCDPHRSEVLEAADQLGLSVMERDLDSSSELVAEYQPLNVPAVAVEGKPESLAVGAFPADQLVERLRPHLDTSA